MKVSQRSSVAPFAVMEVLEAVGRRRSAGEDVFSLCAGEPGGGTPADVRALAVELLGSGRDLGYTEALGVPELRRAIAGHYARWYGLGVDPAQIAITTGSSGGFVLAFLAAFDAGDRVALARPGYPAYRNILIALGCEVVDIPCGAETRYQPTPALLDAAVAEHGELAGLIVASPANPTGTMIEPGELAELSAWCSASGTRLVSDEIYHGITYGESRGSCAWEHGREAIVISSFSKYWGMTGWRLGWALLPEELVAPVDALTGNITLCPPALAQQAGVAAFTERSYADAAASVERYRGHRQLILDRLPALGWGEVAPADGAFYVYADIGEQIRVSGARDSVEWCKRLLDETGVALTPGTDFDAVDGTHWVRLSFAASTDVIEGAFDRLEAWQARGRTEG